MNFFLPDMNLLIISSYSTKELYLNIFSSQDITTYVCP